MNGLWGAWPKSSVQHTHVLGLRGFPMASQQGTLREPECGVLGPAPWPGVPLAPLESDLGWNWAWEAPELPRAEPHLSILAHRHRTPCQPLPSQRPKPRGLVNLSLRTSKAIAGANPPSSLRNCSQVSGTVSGQRSCWVCKTKIRESSIHM